MFGARRSLLDRGLDAFERRDWKRARRLLEDALQEEERAVGHYHLGVLYWRGLGGERELRGGVDCFSRAADMGYPAAQTAYAMALRAGTGVARDGDAAAALFREAAGAGDRQAMVELAAMSPPEDARYWLMRACELGHAPAMLRYGDLIMGHDPVEALAWLYASVALSADEAARKRAAALAREMSAKEIEDAQKTGRQYAKDIQRNSRER